MNNLTICQHGHSRSVCLARLFHDRGEVAVSIGWQFSGSALPWLCAWADRIFIMESSFLRFVPADHHPKVVDFNVGPDIWVNPYHPDLIAKIKAMMKEKGI